MYEIDRRSIIYLSIYLRLRKFSRAGVPLFHSHYGAIKLTFGLSGLLRLSRAILPGFTQIILECISCGAHDDIGWQGVPFVHDSVAEGVRSKFGSTPVLDIVWLNQIAHCTLFLHTGCFEMML